MSRFTLQPSNRLADLGSGTRALVAALAILVAATGAAWAVEDSERSATPTEAPASRFPATVDYAGEALDA